MMHITGKLDWLDGRGSVQGASAAVGARPPERGRPQKNGEGRSSGLCEKVARFAVANFTSLRLANVRR